jgi:hypothetical protein
VLATSLLNRMSALVSPSSRFLAGGGISLFFHAQGLVSMIVNHCRVCKCCVEALGFLMYVLCPFFIK